MVQSTATTIADKINSNAADDADTLRKGSWEFDLDAHMLTWDADQYKIYGYAPNEILLNDEYFIINTTHPSDIVRVSDIIKNALKNEEGYNFKRKIFKRNGSLGYVETRATILRKASGSPTKICGNTFDICGQMINGIYDFNDPLFFKKLYRNYKKTINAEIYKKTFDKELANDLCQEVFVKAWKNLNRYRAEKAGIYTWLLNIARNHCTDYFRSKYFNSNKITTTLDYTLHEKIDSLSDTRIFIAELLVHLTNEQRELIDLLFIQGFTQEEVSHVKGLPLGTIKTKSRSAIKMLRKLAGISNPIKSQIIKSDPSLNSYHHEQIV